MFWIARGLLLVFALALALAATGSSAFAQEEDAAGVVLLPHSSEGYEIESVVPEGWTDIGQGIFARQQSDTDSTVLAQQSVPAPAADVLTSLLPQLALTEAPESVGTHQGAALEWTLYQIDVAVADIEVTVDLALAEDDGTTYLVLLQTSPEEYDALHDSVFLPALDALAPLVVAQGPVPYLVEEVTFPNGDVALAGTLTMPETPGPHPVVLLVSGSGPQDRDETLGGGIAIKPFRLLADALTRDGVAVLRYDDRGVGDSTGTFSEATVQDFATDAEAAIAYLLTREEIDPDHIGLLGHSEGGLVAAMLGARNEDLDFIINLAGPGVDGREVLILQNQRILEAEGASEEEIAAQVAFIEEATTMLDDPEALETLIYEHILARAQASSEEEQAMLGDLEEYARMMTEQTTPTFTADWFGSFIAYDPGQDWAQTTIPMLSIYGGKDVQVDAAQNAPPLASALLDGGNEDIAIVVLPDANHLFQAAGTGSPTEYGTLPSEFTPDLVPTILDWLALHLDDAPAAPAATPAATPAAPMATPVA